MLHPPQRSFVPTYETGGLENVPKGQAVQEDRLAYCPFEHWVSKWLHPTTNRSFDGVWRTAKTRHQLTGLGPTRFTNIIDEQVAISDIEAWPSRPPFGDVFRRKMAIKRGLIGP